MAKSRGENEVRLTFRLPSDLHAAIAGRLAVTERSLNAELVYLVRRGLEQESGAGDGAVNVANIEALALAFADALTGRDDVVVNGVRMEDVAKEARRAIRRRQH